MEKTVKESMIEQVYAVRPQHLNSAGRLFGGKLMEWIDETASLAAVRHAGHYVVTASVDNLTFIRGVNQHEIVVLVARLTYVGRTSMEVRVDTYVEKLDGMRYPVNRAYLTMVAVDDDGRPCEVPSLKTESVGEQAEWEAGKKRSELRRKRKKEGFSSPCIIGVNGL